MIYLLLQKFECTGIEVKPESTEVKPESTEMKPENAQEDVLLEMQRIVRERKKFAMVIRIYFTCILYFM